MSEESQLRSDDADEGLRVLGGDSEPLARHGDPSRPVIGLPREGGAGPMRFGSVAAIRPAPSNDPASASDPAVSNDPALGNRPDGGHVEEMTVDASAQSSDDDLDAWSTLRSAGDDWETDEEWSEPASPPVESLASDHPPAEVDLTERAADRAITRAERLTAAPGEVAELTTIGVGGPPSAGIVASTGSVGTDAIGATDVGAPAGATAPTAPTAADPVGYRSTVEIIPDDADPGFDDPSFAEQSTELFAERPSAETPSSLRRPILMTDDPDDLDPNPVGDHDESAADTGQGAGRNLPVAFGVGMGFVALAALAFSLGPAYAMALVAVILGVCAVEYFNATFAAGYQPATLLGLMATVALPVAVYWRGVSAYPVVLFLSVAAGLLWYLFGISDDRPVHNLGVTLLGIFYIGGMGSFAARMLASDVKAISTLLAVVVLTVAYDTGGYAIGRSMGRTPLTATSPNKTWEGLIGGALVAVIVSVIVVGIAKVGVFGDNIMHAVALGVVVALAAAVGDLSESLVKRDLGLKDMSDFLPGHGGFLDRFDAMLFVLPTAYYLGVILDLFPS